jgi:hypothetical protein
LPHGLVDVTDLESFFHQPIQYLSFHTTLDTTQQLRIR